MSHCGALPKLDSESNILVDACLARVRADVGDDPVLPSLRAIVSPPRTPQLRLVVGGDEALPSPEAIVHANPARRVPQRDIATVRYHEVVQRMRWPVFLCGFLAGIFGGVAVMKSPVGDKPAVQQMVKRTQATLATAYTAARLRLIQH